MLAILFLTLTQNWPAAGGPNGSWTVEGPAAPTEWSVVRDQNIAWRSELPEGGQSGIAVWGERLFLTTMAPWLDEGEEGRSTDHAERVSRNIVGYCLDAKTGEILWQRAINGQVASPNLYAYSDVSTPSPLVDGEHVWFYNAGGAVTCFDFAGEELWSHSWKPWSVEDGFPFNKQFEPILYGDWVLNVEPLDEDHPKRVHGWNYLRALNKQTGKTEWIAKDATTTYNTPVFGIMRDGRPAVIHGRGGWHGVPETPVGLSATSLAEDSAGKTLWRYMARTDANGARLEKPGSLGAPTWQALYVQHWDREHAYWFVQNPVESHLVLDSMTGAIKRQQSLVHDVDYRHFDPERKELVLEAKVNLRSVEDWSPRMNFDKDKHVLVVHPAWHANVVAEGYHWFLCSTAHNRNSRPNQSRPKREGIAGPSHCVGRVHIESGKVEYLELPVSIARSVDSAEPDEWIWGEAQRTETLNSRGKDPVKEERSRTDGWQIPAFWGSPIAVNCNVYFTTTLGLTYVFDGKAKALDADALLSINDLGAIGDTWTLNSMSYAEGRLYHRTLREVVCIAAER